MLTCKRLSQLCQDGFTDQTGSNHMANFTGPTAELTCLCHAPRSYHRTLSPEHSVQYKYKINNNNNIIIIIIINININIL